MSDIKKQTTINENNIRLLVDSFYAKARKHPKLGPVFEETIQDQWDSHFEKLYRFWETHLLKRITYTGSPVPLHHDLNLKVTDFDIWLQLFFDTIDEIYTGDAASKVKIVADTFVRSFKKKL